MRAGGAQEIREVRAGGAQEIRETDERAGVAREAEVIADNSEENAALAFATRAGGARETDERAGVARKALAGEGGVADNSVEEIADNFTEGDEFPEEDAAVLERLQHSSKRLE